MDDQKLTRALRSIGKKCFVEHFKDFAMYDATECAKIISSNHPEYTDNSCHSRASHAKMIFNNHCEKRALEMISRSNRVDYEAKQKCEALLNSM